MAPAPHGQDGTKHRPGRARRWEPAGGPQAAPFGGTHGKQELPFWLFEMTRLLAPVLRICTAVWEVTRASDTPHVERGQ